MEITLLVSALVQSIVAAIAVWVAVRAWRDLAGRLFVGVAVSLLMVNLGYQFNVSKLGLGTSIMSMGLSLLTLFTVLMLSCILVPQWWKAARGWPVVVWIALPYGIIGAVAVLALWGDILSINKPAELPALRFALFNLLTLGWLVIVGVLMVGFVQRPQARPVIGVLMVSVVMSCGLGMISGLQSRYSLGAQLSSLLTILPLLFGFAFLALRSRLVEPTRAALDEALSSMSEMIVVSDAEGRVRYTNAQGQRLGLQLEQNALEVLQQGSSLEPAWLNSLEAGQLVQTRLGQKILQLKTTPLLDRRQRRYGSLLMGRDVTELEERNTQLEQANQQLRFLANHDSLTGLPNRRQLEGFLAQTIAEAHSSRPYTLMLIDLDHFKVVNDTLGHAAGDRLLVEISEVLQGFFAEGDCLARLGGDEFAALVDASLHDTTALAQRIVAAVESYPFFHSDQQFRLGASLGLVEVDGILEASTLLSQADVAMYAAKAQGGGRFKEYNEADHIHQLYASQQMLAQIRSALREGRLELHYQPVVEVSSGQVRHLEALLRMRGPDGALISPGQFIPVAERFGLISELDRWVVAEAICQLATHSQARLFVNLSARTLEHSGLVQQIAAMLEVAGVVPRRLGFEITETAALQNSQSGEAAIHGLKALGCCIALDDFGVGFTSFAYLRDLPIDQIKIDGSFIRQLENPTNQAIVAVMRDLAQALKTEAVAEWVESEALLQAVRRLGIDLSQGYHTGRPQANLAAALTAQFATAGGER